MARLPRLALLSAIVFLSSVILSSHIEASSSTRKAKEIVRKHVSAIGGMSKIKSFQEMKISGRMMASGFEFPFVLWMKRPDRSRMDLDLQGQTIIQAYDGQTAWWVNPFIGATQPTEMPDELADGMMRWVDFDGPLVDYKKKGHRVDFVGMEDLTTGPAYKIELTLKDGSVWFAYIDRGSYYEVKRTYPQTYQGVTTSVDTYFSEFETIEGVVTPKIVKGVSIDGSPYTMFFDAFDSAEKVDEAMFKMPR